MPGDRDRHPELPVDPDRESDRRQHDQPQHDLPRHGPARPQHTQALLLLLVAFGGFLGAGARYAVALALPSRGGHWPTGTFVVNLVGAFALGLLLEVLARRGPDEGWRRRMRLFLGTGFCGAFTTYSTLAVEADLLVRDDAGGQAVAYVVVSLLAGLIASAAGIAAATAVHLRRRSSAA